MMKKVTVTPVTLLKDVEGSEELVENVEEKMKNSIKEFESRGGFINCLCSLMLMKYYVIGGMIAVLFIIPGILSAFNFIIMKKMKVGLSDNAMHLFSSVIERRIQIVVDASDMFLDSYRTNLISMSDSELQQALTLNYLALERLSRESEDRDWFISMQHSSGKITAVSGSPVKQSGEVYYYWPSDSVFQNDSFTVKHHTFNGVPSSSPLYLKYGLYEPIVNTTQTKWGVPFVDKLSCSGKIRCNVAIPYTTYYSNSDGGISSTVTLILDGLEQLAKDIQKHMDGGIFFIMDRQSGKLLATSETTTDLYETVNSVDEILQATDSDHSFINQVATNLNEKYGNKFTSVHHTPNTPLLTHFSTKSEGLTYVGTMSITNGQGLDIILVLATPTLRLYGNVFVALVVVMVFTSLLVPFAGSLGWIQASRVVSNSIDVDDMLRVIVTFKLEQVPIPKWSYITEYDRTRTSLYQVALKLIEYKAYLPSYILQRDFGVEDNTKTDKVRRGSLIQEFRRPRSSSVDTNSSGNSLSKSTETFKFSLGLDSLHTCIMIVQVQQYEEALNRLTPTEYVRKHGVLLNIVERAATKFRGTMTHFNQKGFVICWNNHTHRTMKTLSCEAALLIQTCFTSEEGMNISIGIAHESSYIGNIGTNTKKKYISFGKADKLAKIACSLCEEWGCGILVTETVTTKVADNFVLRPICSIQTKFAAEQTRLFQVVRFKQMKDDEWMYELEAKKKHEEYVKYCEAYRLFEVREFEKARELFEQFFRDNHETDRPTLNYLSKCHELLGDNVQLADESFCK
jgi:class 3 adenylate cyclase